MGNALSESDDDGKMEHGNDADDEVSDEDDSNDLDGKQTTDLCQLFGDSTSLRAAASKVKEKIPENVILQHNSHIFQWLQTRQERQEDSISMAQFCEMLMDKGVERSDAIKAFHQFDCDGSGVADVQTMMETLEHFSSHSGLGELGKSVRILQSCSLTPGFVDVYGGLTDPVEKHGKRIQQYLHRNRTETPSLPFPYLNSFNIIYVMRSAVLKSILHAAKEDVKNIDSDKDSTEMERWTTNNCYSSIEVSSNNSEAHHLRHNAMFWQSDGAARSHWIRLRMKNNIIIKHLSIGVSSSDESYMPEQVTIAVGSTPARLREIKDIKVEKHYSGRVVLLRNMKMHYPYIQINIKRCHVDGCDTRIHGIKAIGYKLVKEQGITVMDASALWYLQMLTSTINFNLPQSPILRNTLLGQTKKALEYMPPLVLSPSSPEKPVFLSKYVLQEIETFAHQLSFSPDIPEQLSEEGIEVVLALNLARGSVSALTNLLSGIIELPSLSLPCADLLSKAITAKNSCLEKLGVPVPVSFVGGDGGPGQTNAGPDTLVDSSGSNSGGKATSSSGGYLTDEGKTKCTLIFKSEQLVQLTKIRIQVTSGSKGAKRGLVFVYNADSVPELNTKFDADEHIVYLNKYDFWKEKEFEFSVQYRNAGLGGLPDNPVAYFCFDTDSDEIDVPAQWGAVGKYIIVKVLEPKHETATRIGIVSLKFFGLIRPVALDYRDQKPLAVPDAEKKETCDLPEICSLVLTFVTEIASEQVKRLKGPGLKSQTDFLDLSELNLTQLWDLHRDCEKRAEKESGKPADLWQRCAVLVLQLIHGLIPMLAVSKNTTETNRDSLFEQLCDITNAQTPEAADTLSPYMSNKLKMVKQIIVDGAPLFFPEKSRKRLELFKLLQTVSDQSSKPSISLVFQSLCQFFSSVDPRGLLELPNELTQDFAISSTLDLMKSLLNVACQEMQRMKQEVSLSNKQKAKLAEEMKDKPQEVPDDKLEATKGDGSHSQSKETGNSSSKAEEHSTTDGASPSSSSEMKETGATVKKSDDSTPKVFPEKAEGNLKAKELETNTVKTEKKVEGAASQTEVGGGEGSKPATLDAKDEKESEEEGRMVYLVMLAASLQTSLFSWLWQQLETKSVADDKKLIDIVQTMIKEYTQDVADKAYQFFEIFKTMSLEDLQAKAVKKEPAFLHIILRQLLLLLMTVVDKLDTETKVTLLQSFKKLIISASDVAKANPDVFLDIDSECWDKVDTEETVLRTWEVESPHEYQNHSNIVQVFNCPGASKLVVDFDIRCETEKRYDYLEFTDSKGLKLHFDQKVGSTKWPLKVTFSGPYVHFIFHSDSSNTEWGYKFTVTAHGTPDTQNSWLSDLHLGLVKVLGQLAGATLSSNPIVPQESTMVGEDTSEHDILRSNLWTSLFRGGYMVGKLERTLSGKFATSDDSRVHALLTEVVNVAAQRQEDAGEETNDMLQKQARRLLSKCRETKTKTALQIGGIKVDEAVTSLFASLVWHCQSLREDLDKFLNNDLTSEVSDGILQAFNVAESVRLSLASERQRWNAQEDNKKESELDPAELFSSKALYLMRFAGLTKVQLRQEMRSKFYKQMVMKKAGNKQPSIWTEGMDKYPSFRLVMEFIQDPVWTAERVHLMLQERSKFASAISEVYMFSAEMLRVMSNKDPFQIPVVLYFREVSAYQHQFARHYADGLDGCGLSQEARVRSSYYTLIRRFVDAFRQNEGLPRHSKKAPAYDILQCILLHLLDVEWQPYDLSFIHEMQLPQLFMNFAKETVKMRDICTSEVKEEEELEEYNLYMKWFKEVAGDFGEWMKRMGDSVTDKKSLKWFIARFSDVLDVEITCDGCRTTLPGRRYRCLQCMDMDLCTACFIGGVEPEEHQDTHEIVHLVYKCNHCQGFIVSSRIHCNECDDFDLCLGCHLQQKFPSGHTEKHDVTKIPMMKLVPVKTNPSSSSSLQAYIHQHAWLLYASLTLTLSDAVYSQDTGFTFMDPDYFRVACLLQQQCLDQAIHCLDQVSCEIEGEGQEVPLEKRREQTFAMHSQERIMGLLGAVMPSKVKKEQTSECGYNFCTEDFLDRLLKVSRGDQGHELNTHHLALRLMGRLLAHSHTRLADISTRSMVSPEVKTNPATMVCGQQTVAYLFSFGAKAFERSGLEWACSVARMLEMLLGARQWQLAIQQHITQCIQSLKHNVQPSSIFPMFVIAGFPEVLTTGALVDYTYTSLDSQSGVVLKHFPDKCQTLVIDLKTRKRHTVKDQQVSCRTDVADVLEAESIDKFVLFAIDTISRIQNGEELSVETLWVLSLALKVLNRCFQSEALMVAAGKDVFSKNFVQCLVSLCCKGTGLNQNWLLKDLEVLSLMWYTHDGSTVKKSKHKSTKKVKGKRKKQKKKSYDGDNSEEDEFSGMFMNRKGEDGLSKDEDDEDDDDYDPFKSDSEDDSLHYITDSSNSDSQSSKGLFEDDSDTCKGLFEDREIGGGLFEDKEIGGGLFESDSDTCEGLFGYDSDTCGGLFEASDPKAPPKTDTGLQDDDNKYLDELLSEVLVPTAKKEEATSPAEDKKETDKAEETGAAEGVGQTSENNKIEEAMWDSLNLEPGFKEFLEEMLTKLDIPYLVLHAICVMNNGDSEEILKSIAQNCGEEKEKTLADYIKKWKEASEDEQKDTLFNEGVYIDKGIAGHTNGEKVNRILKVAEDELGDNPQNLFQHQEMLAQEISERQRGKSAQLLKKELEKHGRSGPRDSLHKVNLAMCVLYARYTLTSLLAHWPDTGPPINSTLMGCKDVKQIPSVLDLLHKIDSQFFFSKVVDKVIHLCDAASLVPIAFTAAQFMEELKLQAVTCESSHNYTLADKKKGQIQLPGASYLTITFDSRCATAEDDILKFSDSQKLGSSSHMFCGCSPAKWSSFSLPGDSLFYRFCLEDYDPDVSNYWGYKFTVTPGICDSFETGHTILKAVLSSTVARSLPLGHLWTSLVYVACKQPGTQRLKVINLMLKIVVLQSKANCDNEHKTKPDIDLSLLRPLWELYQSMTSKHTDQASGASGASSGANAKSGTSFQPAVMRALTTLFLHTENLATEWGVAEEYLAALSDIHPSLFQGLLNVAAVGLEINHPNLATDLFKRVAEMMKDGDVLSTLKSKLNSSKSVVESKEKDTAKKGSSSKETTEKQCVAL